MTDKEERPDLGGELAADHDAARVVVEVAGDGNSGLERDLLATIRRLVRVKGGGDVQRAFGFVRPQMASDGGRLDLGGGSATEQAQEPPVVTCSGGVTLPALGGGSRG